MAKKMRISFDETDPLHHLKKQRVDVAYQLLRTKDKKIGKVLQTELASINKKIRGF